MVSRSQALLIVLLVWAAIYLPALGSLEIKGEEGRRILPAVRMIETGNYIVPRVGSEPYLRKPPLINWLVAASFKIFGQRNEWTARLPSVLCVLAVALVFITVARRSLGATGSTVAALIWLTNFGMIEKGRLIEIEALYVSLFAIAFVCWLSWWEENRSPWLTWLVPWIFLGLGWLAKGPMHLFFFYAIVIAVLWRSRELRTIWNVPHLIGLILMVSIFAAWAIPFLKMTDGAHVAQVWSRQFSGRLAGEGFNFGDWALNIPRSLGYFLPWIVFVPLLVGTKSGPEERRQNVRSAHRPQAYVPSALFWASLIPLSDCRSDPRIAATLHDAAAGAIRMVARLDSDCRNCGVAAMARRKNFLPETSTTRNCSSRGCHLCSCLHLRRGNCSAFAGAAKSENYRGENRGRCSRIGAALRGRSRLSTLPLLRSPSDHLRKPRGRSARRSILFFSATG